MALSKDARAFYASGDGQALLKAAMEGKPLDKTQLTKLHDMNRKEHPESYVQKDAEKKDVMNRLVLRNDFSRISLILYTRKKTIKDTDELWNEATQSLANLLEKEDMEERRQSLRWVEEELLNWGVYRVWENEPEDDNLLFIVADILEMMDAILEIKHLINASGEFPLETEPAYEDEYEDASFCDVMFRLIPPMER